METAQVLLGQKEEEAQKFQDELQASKSALREVEQRLEYQDAELKFAQTSAIDTEKQMKLASQEVQDSQATVRQQEAELVRLREVLRRTERELDERVAHLEQRCLLSEEERSTFNLTLIAAAAFSTSLKHSSSPNVYCVIFRQNSRRGAQKNRGAEDGVELVTAG